MLIKSATVWTRRKVVQTLEEFYFSRESRLQSSLQACLNELDKEKFSRASSEPRPNAYLFCLTILTKNVISGVPSLWLEYTLWHWKNNSKIYKVMFHKVWLILIFVRSKLAIKRRLQNGSCTISPGWDCRRPCVKNTFWPCSVAMSGWHMFSSKRRIPVIVLSEYKLFLGSTDDGAIINTKVWIFTPESSFEATLREIICGEP